MSVVLNEVKEAERILKIGEVGNKPTSTLFLLGKYYRQKNNLDKTQTSKALDSFMRDNYKNYNPALWENIVEDISKKANKYPLREIDSIGITQGELDEISKLENIKYKKLVFTLLCFAKLYNTISENNNGWVNVGIPEIFRISRVAVKYKKDKFLYLNDIEKSGLISFSNKNDNLNLKVNFLSDGLDKDVMSISDFRELGYEYLNYIGDGNFIRCSECGRLVRKKSKFDSSTKYCNECSSLVKAIQKKEWDRKNR